MIGALFALCGALAFALANVAIAKGGAQGHRDNGALLSIILTALVSGGLWCVLGDPLPAPGRDAMLGIAFFMTTGILATVIGRLTLFRSVTLAGAINAGLFRRLIPLFAALFAFLILGETIGPLAGLGMAIILASLLMVVSVKASKRPAEAADRTLPDVRRGQLFGTLSASSYGASYIARKLGMVHIPDPTLGTFVGAVTGLAWYACAYPFSARYRRAVTGMLRETGRWQFVAALSMSFGQTAQFFALLNADVAVVAIIGSLEVFIGIYLAAYIFRTEAPPSLRVIIASVVATIGVILVAVA